MPDPEATARAKKAEALADTIYALARRGDIPMTVEYVESLRAQPALASQVESVAPIRRPASEATWDVVVDIVRRRGPCWPHDPAKSSGICRKCGYDLFRGI